MRLEQVAEVLRCEPEVLQRLLERAPGVLPGAVCGADGWEVPERALRVLLGAPCGPLPQMVTVEDVATALRRSVKTVYGWLKLLVPGPRGELVPLLPHRRVLGSILIDAAAVMRLPASMPGPRPSFFCAKEGPSADE